MEMDNFFTQMTLFILSRDALYKTVTTTVYSFGTKSKNSIFDS